MTPNLIAQKYVDEFEKSYGEIALIDVVTKAVEEGVKLEREAIASSFREAAGLMIHSDWIGAELLLKISEVIRSREEGK